MPANAISSPKQRLLSLDFFRGLTVAAMILVNNPGDWGHIYAPLKHSVWNGCTPTDLVFPFFLFIVGVSIVYALDDKKRDSSLHKKLILNALRRAVMIFALGILLMLIPAFQFATMRIPGVLQRIAIVFLICAFLYIKANTKTLAWIFAILLLVYWLLMALVPVPGIGEANLQPGTNLAAWIDHTILTEAHMWTETKTWDPEGILSTLPAISTGLFGVMVGAWLKRKDRQDAEKVSWMFCIGIFSVLIALVWNVYFPINKSIWTSSFVLYTGGLATIGLALSYWMIDVQGYKSFTKPFVAYGANTITAYVISGIVPMLLDYIHVSYNGNKISLLPYLYLNFFTPNFSPVNASLAWAIAYVIVFLIPVWIMYRKKIFIRI
jgi:predicted acyltransferase